MTSPLSVLALLAAPGRADPWPADARVALAACVASIAAADSPSPAGSVTVVVDIGDDGAPRVIRSSGFEAVDACVVQAARGAGLQPSGARLVAEVRSGATPGSYELARTDDAPAATCPPPPGPFPGEAWPVAAGPAPAGVIEALDAHLFPPDLDRDDPDRAGVRTDGVVIVHRGEILYERYGPGHGPDTPHLAWSATKSFTNALVGVAVRQGRLSLDDTVCDHLPYVPPGACGIRVVDLLEFASGLDWRETYEGQPPTTSSVLAMLYGEGAGDVARFVLAHPSKHPPGTSWRYSSGDTNVLAAIAGAVLAPVHGERFPWAVLLDPIGIRTATWERDRAGTYVGSSYLWATPRDLARFGQLLLADGCWDGARILPEGWVAASTAPSPAIRGPHVYGWEPGEVQGRQLWLNRPLPERGQAERRWPSAPEDAFAALGHWGQSITVIPSAALVVVRTADDRDRSYDHDRTLGLALAWAEAR